MPHPNLAEPPLATRSGKALTALLLRFAAGLLLMLALALAAGPALLRALAPAQQALFHLANPDLRLTQWQQQGRGELFAEVAPKRMLILGGRARELNPLARANASMPLAQTLLGPVLLLAVAGAAPGRWRVQAQRWALALPLALALLLVDAPVVLAGLIWQLLFDLLGPGEASALVLLQQFLQGGGRVALALAAGLAVAWAGRRPG